MDRLEILLAAVAPGLLVLTYAVIKTRSSWNSEALWTAFFLGGLGTIAALPLEAAVHWLTDFGSLIGAVKAGVLAIVAAGLCEEGVKYFILVTAAEAHVDARRRQDLIALSVAVSLGFATVENFAFIAIPDNWHWVATARALSAVPGHGIAGLAMGALLTAARLAVVRRVVWSAIALIIPIVLHAAYDFPLFLVKWGAVGEAESKPLLALVWPTVLLAGAVIAILLCNWVLPLAIQADRVAGRDQRENASASSPIWIGCIFLATVLLLEIFAAHSGASAFSIGLGVTPLALGIDLIWMGYRRLSHEKPWDTRA